MVNKDSHNNSKEENNTEEEERQPLVPVLVSMKYIKHRNRQSKSMLLVLMMAVLIKMIKIKKKN